MRKPTGTVLCVFNYAPNTGYAWDFLEDLYARVADGLAERGIVTFVGYPTLSSMPRNLAASRARPVALDASLRTVRSIWQTCGFIRRQRVRVVCFTDRAALSPAYWWLRIAGARRIIVYDHTSGARTPASGLKRLVKWLVARLPGLVADCVVAVSEYVAERQRKVALIPRERVTRVWNGLPLPTLNAPDSEMREAFGLVSGRPLVLCCCRAAREKGVEYLLRAFDLAWRRLGPGAGRPVLLYVGDGPYFPTLEALRDTLASRSDIVFAGYRTDARECIRAADICVVPSLWQEALPLGVLEPMAFGKPIVASRVGGVPEMVQHGVEGLLVPPGDVEALANAILALVGNRAWAEEMGGRARRRVAQEFTPERQVAALLPLLEAGFGRGPSGDSPGARRRAALS